jgi:hypothetical protein
MSVEDGVVAPAESATEILRQTCFVTGADQNYFWLVAAAVQSLREHAPSLQLKVMDFGFSGQQAAFLEAQGLLLARPRGVPTGLHPYTLKTLFAAYVSGLSHANFAWFDSDIICTDPHVTGISEVLATMKAQGVNVAACPDMGPHPTLSQFANAFHAPALADFVTRNAQCAQRPYLNTGFILFSDASRFLDEWPRITSRIQGEICIDQNAFNILFHQNPEAGFILPSRRWNAHSGLLSEVNEVQGRLYCGDQAVTFLHCTSNGNTLHTEQLITIKIAGVEQKARFKTFRNPSLSQIQLGYLSRFVKEHAADLRAHGVA